MTTAQEVKHNPPTLCSVLRLARGPRIRNHPRAFPFRSGSRHSSHRLRHEHLRPSNERHMHAREPLPQDLTGPGLRQSSDERGHFSRGRERYGTAEVAALTSRRRPSSSSFARLHDRAGLRVLSRYRRHHRTSHRASATDPGSRRSAACHEPHARVHLAGSAREGPAGGPPVDEPTAHVDGVESQFAKEVRCP